MGKESIKSKTINVNDMGKRNQSSLEDRLYTVIVKDGKQFLCFNGQVLPNQKKTIVVQDVTDALMAPAICEITVTVIAILDNTE